MIAAYIKQEDGTYKASNEIPSSGYTINEEKSVCSNGAKASWKILGTSPNTINIPNIITTLLFFSFI